MTSNAPPPSPEIAAPAVDVVFFGSGAFGLPTVKWLHGAGRLVGIVTQPDRPAGRGATLTPTPVAAWAAEHAPGVPIVKAEKVNEAGPLAEVRGWACGAWVVIAFGQKLSAALLADRFAVNLHGSLLPRWRGAAPIHAAILAGDAEIGSSVITLAQTMDAGLVLARSARARDPMRTTGEMHDLLAAEGPGLIGEVLRRRATGEIWGETQDPARVTLARKLKKEEGWIDFARPAVESQRRVHGLNPWPGVTVRFRGQELKVLRVGVTASGGEAGVIVDAAGGVVACGEGAGLVLMEVQSPGKRPMAWGEFARGARVVVGERVEGRGGGA